METRRHVTVLDGQTLADIAVQEYGGMEAVTGLAEANGMAVSDVPGAGAVLRLPELPYNRTMRDWCRANGVSPATLRDGTGDGGGVFTREFAKEFT